MSMLFWPESYSEPDNRYTDCAKCAQRRAIRSQYAEMPVEVPPSCKSETAGRRAWSAVCSGGPAHRVVMVGSEAGVSVGPTCHQGSR